MDSKLNEGLKDLLNNYLESSNLNGAFFIRGKWGIGKSYFINNFIDELEKKEQEEVKINKTKEERKIIYVSLNGLTSFDDIDKAILAQIHPTFTKIKNYTVTKCFLGLFKIAAKSNPHMSIDLDNKKIEKVFKIKGNLVLIFDDLERCQIDIAQTLGYINQFVEEKGFKVIVLGNDEEIRNYKSIAVQNQENVIAAILSLNKINAISKNNKNESDSAFNGAYQRIYPQYDKNPNKDILDKIINEISKVDYYSVIKEKVFSLEYDYKFDIDVAYAQMKETLEKHEISNVEFVTLVKIIRCENLRSYLLSLFYIDDYIKKDDKFMEYDLYIRKAIIINIIIEVVLYKNPRLLSEPIDYSLNIVCYNNATNNKYGKYNKYYLFKFIHTYIYAGIIDAENTKNIIEEYKQMINVEKGINQYTSLAKLKSKSIFDYEDDELEVAIKDLYVDMLNNKIPLKYYFNCYYYFYFYDEVYKFKNEQINCRNFYKIMNDNLKLEKSEIDYDEHELYFMQNDTLKKAYLEIQKAFDDHNNKIKVNDFNIKLIECEKGLNYRDYEQFAYEMKTFLGLFDMKIVCDFLRNSTNDNLRDFATIFNKIYQISNVKDFFTSDIPHIKMLIKCIDEELDNAGNVRKHIFNFFKDDAEKVLNKLNS